MLNISKSWKKQENNPEITPIFSPWAFGLVYKVRSLNPLCIFILTLKIVGINCCEWTRSVFVALIKVV